MTRKVKITLNDIHSGSKLGLLNPLTVLHEEDRNGDQKPYYPAPTASQEYLWELYTGHIEEAFRFADGCEMLLNVNGDITQGVKHRGHWVSNRMADQIVCAVYNLLPWFAYPNLKHVRISIGTAAHNFDLGSSEVLVGHMLSDRFREVDIKIANHYMIDYEGVSFDIAHHGPGKGIRNWLYGNVARYYLRDLMRRDIMAGREPPDVVERAHVHCKVHELLETGAYQSELFTVPSYCMMDDFGVQVTKSLEGLTHGLLMHEVDAGRRRSEWLTKTLDVRMREEL